MKPIYIKTFKFKSIFFLLAFSAVTVFARQKIKLTILHTNDTHSQVEPTE